jgi:hypothetical protein
LRLKAFDLAAKTGALWGAIRAAKNAASRSVESACDKASDHARVMLHLRVRYVSKAAILTIPATLLPVENRSPA